ncbi:MAG: hypothetical protein LBG60_05155, partial [Bifidobacteriaceae bacterium]|nr:hypothetical protein [Bifidobacteriaceae bacterium]
MTIETPVRLGRPADRTPDRTPDRHADRYRRLRERKIAETRRKNELYGARDEDDYNTHIPPADYRWVNRANHPDGLFYGFEG